MDEIEIKNRKKVYSMIVLEIISLFVLAIVTFGGNLFPVNVKMDNIRIFLYLVSIISVFIFAILGITYTSKIVKSVLKISSYIFMIVSLILGVLSALQIMLGIFLGFIINSATS